ncbi:hypothetical protein [Alicyclobacillus sacchari]|uniref:hypothetical protein n=1 Tax=Alicyclobacillus sacchari TaxID=392010 RepID=UPI003D66764B
MYVYIAQQSGGHSWLVILLGWFGACLTAYAYRRLARAFPGGSIYSYVGHALQSDIGWIAAWIILADYLFVRDTVCQLLQPDRRVLAASPQLDMVCAAQRHQSDAWHVAYPTTNPHLCTGTRLRTDRSLHFCRRCTARFTTCECAAQHTCTRWPESVAVTCIRRRDWLSWLRRYKYTRW